MFDLAGIFKIRPIVIKKCLPSLNMVLPLKLEMKDAVSILIINV